jgi:hypothetical protein
MKCLHLQEWKGDFLKLITLLVDHTEALEIDEVDIPNDHKVLSLHLPTFPPRAPRGLHETCASLAILSCATG